MRKRITKNLLTAVALCTALSAEAYDFEAGGIYYNITSETDKTVEVTSGSYAGDIKIPSTVNNGGKTYTVTSIRDEAFYWCRNLTSVNIPEEVTTIGHSAFGGCNKLTSVNIPDGITEIGERFFYLCSSLTSIDIPDGVTEIGEGAFSGCSSLTSITIPDGVTTIGDYAFSRCSSLTEINCLATVPPVCGKDCFYDVDKDKCTLHVPEGTEETYKTAITWKEFLYEGKFSVEGINYAITSSLNKTVDVISGGNYTGNITIPATVINNGTTYAVTSIGNSAFSLCSELTSISLPNGVTSIGDSAFENCYDLTSIDIPDGVTSIAGRAFYRCSGLTSIDIPDGVTEIGEWAFRECSGLTSINIPDGVTEIGEWAFSSCSLISINIPEKVTSISQGVFHWCGSLTSIDIPDGVTSIGANAFEGCINLAEIYCAANVPPVCGNYCFDNVNKTACTLYVPEGTADDYRVADKWNDFTNIVGTDFAGIEEIAADAAADVTVYAAAGRIVVENVAAGTPIAVYSADGMLIYSGVVSDTRTEIPAPAGKLYIVKCGNAVFKTVM